MFVLGKMHTFDVVWKVCNKVCLEKFLWALFIVWITHTHTHTHTHTYFAGWLCVCVQVDRKEVWSVFFTNILILSGHWSRSEAVYIYIGIPDFCNEKPGQSSRSLKSYHGEWAPPLSIYIHTIIFNKYGSMILQRQIVDNKTTMTHPGYIIINMVISNIKASYTYKTQGNKCRKNVSRSYISCPTRRYSCCLFLTLALVGSEVVSFMPQLCFTPGKGPPVLIG
jgi:hypothetical protein